MDRTGGKPQRTPETLLSSGGDPRTKTPTRPFSTEAIPERFNYSIETKKKASIMEKISSLAPFLETLIQKSEIRSAQILDRLVELRGQLDDIFDEISSEFEAAMSENDTLRRNLENVPRPRPSQTADVQRLQRTVDQLGSELEAVRQRERQAREQLQMMQRDNREAYEALEGIKRESERIKASNSDLQERIRVLSARQLPPGVSPEEVQRIRAELQRQQRKSMGVEDNARRKLAEYESRLQAENKKYRDLEQIHAALARKSDLNEDQIRQLKQAIEKQGRKSLTLQQNIRRKIQQSQETNTELKRKLDTDQRELQARIRRIQDLEVENAERERKLKDFARKSDLNEKEIAEIKAMMEKERRQSVVNEENLLRKLKQVEDEKKGLLGKASQNEQKAREYEEILDKLSNEVEVQRRESMAYQKGATDKIKILQRQNTDLNQVVVGSKEKQAQDERRLRELYESIKDKQNKYKEYIGQISRKSNLHEDEIRLLQQELDKERRKSLADEAQIKKLERVIDDQTKNTKEQVAMLQAEIEKERRKSMADEAAIRKMEQILNEKVYFLNQSEKKHGLAVDEIQFLKDEIEKERRKSTQDEGVIRKLQQILAEKERYMADVDRKGKQADDDIRALKQQIQNERRKSMADEALIKKLQGELAAKIKLANDTHNKYLELARKSEAGDEEVRFLKAEIDKERRKSNADEATIRKLEQLLNEKLKVIEENKKRQQTNDDEIKFLKAEIEKERRKSMADETKVRKLEEILKEKVGLAEQYNSRYLDEVRKSQVNAKELQFLMAELDKQRRKSMADEGTIKRLEKLIAEKVKLADDMENRHINEIKILKNQIDNERRKSMADQTKIRKLEEILKEKVAEADAQKKQLMELARKTDLNENEIRMLQQEIDNERRKSMADVELIKRLERVIAQKTRSLEERENSLFKNNEDIQFLKAEIDKERRKSMADEAQIKKLEGILQDKMNELRDAQTRAEQLRRKSNLNEQEIKFLKDQMQKERRTSQAGQENFFRKVKELEGAKQDLMNKLEQDKERFIKTANYIKQLEDKNKDADRALGDFSRKSELSSEEIARLKAEMDKERRKSAGLEQTFLPKIHLLVDENQNLVREIENCKSRIKQADDKIADLSEQLDRARQAIQLLEGDNREKARALNELQRAVEQEKSRSQQRVADSVEDKNRVVRDLEGELNRTKQDRSRLQQELQGRVNELQGQRQVLSKLQRALNDKNNNLQESESNNRALAHELNDLKQRERDLIERNNELAERNAQSNIVYEQHLQSLPVSPTAFAKGTKRSEAATTVVVSETSREERQHVIKVLEHERRIYKLENSITKQSPGAHNRTEPYDARSNQDIEPFDTDFGGRDQKFDGRTSSPIRLDGGKQNAKRQRVHSEI